MAEMRHGEQAAQMPSLSNLLLNLVLSLHISQGRGRFLGKRPCEALLTRHRLGGVAGGCCLSGAPTSQYFLLQ